MSKSTNTIKEELKQFYNDNKEIIDARIKIMEEEGRSEYFDLNDIFNKRCNEKNKSK